MNGIEALFKNGWPLESAKLNNNFIYKLNKLDLIVKFLLLDESNIGDETIKDYIFSYLNEGQINELGYFSKDKLEFLVNNSSFGDKYSYGDKIIKSFNETITDPNSSKNITIYLKNDYKITLIDNIYNSPGFPAIYYFKDNERFVTKFYSSGHPTTEIAYFPRPTIPSDDVSYYRFDGWQYDGTEKIKTDQIFTTDITAYSTYKEINPYTVSFYEKPREYGSNTIISEYTFPSYPEDRAKSLSFKMDSLPNPPVLTGTLNGVTINREFIGWDAYIDDDFDIFQSNITLDFKVTKTFRIFPHYYSTQETIDREYAKVYFYLEKVGQGNPETYTVKRGEKLSSVMSTLPTGYRLPNMDSIGWVDSKDDSLITLDTVVNDTILSYWKNVYKTSFELTFYADENRNSILTTFNIPANVVNGEYATLENNVPFTIIGDHYDALPVARDVTKPNGKYLFSHWKSYQYAYYSRDNNKYYSAIDKLELTDGIDSSVSFIPQYILEDTGGYPSGEIIGVGSFVSSKLPDDVSMTGSTQSYGILKGRTSNDPSSSTKKTTTFTIDNTSKYSRTIRLKATTSTDFVSGLGSISTRFNLLTVKFNNGSYTNSYQIYSSGNNIINDAMNLSFTAPINKTSTLTIEINDIIARSTSSVSFNDLRYEISSLTFT